MTIDNLLNIVKNFTMMPLLYDDIPLLSDPTLTFCEAFVMTSFLAVLSFLPV